MLSPGRFRAAFASVTHFPPHAFLDTLDMPTAEGLDLAAELEIPADLLVGKNPVTANHRKRPAGLTEHYGSASTSSETAFLIAMA